MSTTISLKLCVPYIRLAAGLTNFWFKVWNGQHVSLADGCLLINPTPPNIVQLLDTTAAAPSVNGHLLCLPAGLVACRIIVLATFNACSRLSYLSRRFEQSYACSRPVSSWPTCWLTVRLQRASFAVDMCVVYPFCLPSLGLGSQVPGYKGWGCVPRSASKWYLHTCACGVVRPPASWLSYPADGLLVACGPGLASLNHSPAALALGCKQPQRAIALSTRITASCAAHNGVIGGSKGEACLGRRLPLGDRQHLLWCPGPEAQATLAGAKHRNGWNHYGTGYPGSLFHKEPYLSTNLKISAWVCTHYVCTRVYYE